MLFYVTLNGMPTMKGRQISTPKTEKTREIQVRGFFFLPLKGAFGRYTPL